MRLALASQPVRNSNVGWNVRRMEDVLRASRGRADAATGGAACFAGGGIVCEAPAGESSILFVEL